MGCSTPVGIKDRFTAPGRDRRQPAGRVLNACRHQRSVHASSRRSVFSSFACAQRLSASKIGSRNRIKKFSKIHKVLNACRHQRSVHAVSQLEAWSKMLCSTPVGIKDRFTLSGHRHRHQVFVLNACRHQRSVHLIHHAVDSRGIRVLNACRHQRSVHSSANSRRLLICACSTPVGIKDRFTLNWSFSPARPVSAQRLSASKIGSPSCQGRGR